MTLSELLYMNDFIVNRYYKGVNMRTFFDSNDKFIVESSCNFMNIDVNLFALIAEMDVTCEQVCLSVD